MNQECINKKLGSGVLNGKPAGSSKSLPIMVRDFWYPLQAPPIFFVLEEHGNLTFQDDAFEKLTTSSSKMLVVLFAHETNT